MHFTFRSNQDLIKYLAATGLQIDPYVINMDKSCVKDKEVRMLSRVTILTLSWLIKCNFLKVAYLPSPSNMASMVDAWRRYKGGETH